MAAIWSTDEHGSWKLVAPKGFPDEATLHTMVERAPQMLPLSGEPQLTVLGREVQLGNGLADLIAVEPNGRVVVIEVKLSRNPEARRAVVAQILTYAAFLRGLSVARLEQQVLMKHLASRGYASLADAAQSADQTGGFDSEAFTADLEDCLARGSFRLVLVLDEAPGELVRLVGYLETVTDGLLIDLITVSSYEVDRARIVVPQRVDPEEYREKANNATTGATTTANSRPQGVFTEGVSEFLASIDQAPEADRQKLKVMVDWAVGLEQRGLVTLGTFKGTANRWTLLPRIPDAGVGLVTIWNEKGAVLQFWRSVFEKRAPQSLIKLEALLAPTALGQGNTTRNITPELLEALAHAYEEAAGGVTLVS